MESKKQLIMILICHIIQSNSHNLKPTSFHHNRGKALSVNKVIWTWNGSPLFSQCFSQGSRLLWQVSKLSQTLQRWLGKLSLLSYTTRLTYRGKMQGRSPDLVRKHKTGLQLGWYPPCKLMLEHSRIKWKFLAHLKKLLQCLRKHCMCPL